MTPFTFATDLHGNEQDKSAVACFKRFVDDFKPKLKIFGGDLWNLAALRRGADEEEKKIKLGVDLEAGMEFLEWYRPKYFLLGNHDIRLWDAVAREGIEKSGYLAEYAALLAKKFEVDAKKLGITVITYSATKGFITIDGVTFSHGFGSGETMATNMADSYGDVVFGHGHKILRSTVKKGTRAATGYMSGCLCRKDMDYVRNDLSAGRQQHGWIHGVLKDGPRHLIVQPEIINGKAIVATGFKEF